MAKARHVVIVGAGIIGATTALCLRRQGLEVTLVDRGAPGEGCSFGNGGAISPDMCIPMAMPGILRRVPRWLFDPKGPLVVRWKHLPHSIPWLTRWILESRESRVREISKALRALHAPSFKMYESLLGDHSSGLLEMTGQIYAWTSEIPKASEDFSQKLRAEHGIEVEQLDNDALRRLDPHLARHFRHGLFFPENGHTVNPLRLVTTIVALFERQGGRVLQASVKSFEEEGATATAVLQDGAVLKADAYVIAAGIDSGRLAKSLGDRVPLQAERGYHVNLPEPDIRPRIKISNREQMFGITPMETGIRIAGTVEITGPNAPFDVSRCKAMLHHACKMYPGLRTDGATHWMGSRPSMPDSLPVIDNASRHSNIIYAFGHGHFGLTGAPMTAELVTSKLLGRASPISTAPYRLSRFVRGQS